MRSAALLLTFVIGLSCASARASPSKLTVTSTMTVDLNTAPVETLERLPGIGRSRARQIAAQRAKRKLRSVDDLRVIQGIGPKTIAKLRPLVRASP